MELNEQQRKAVEYLDGPLLVLAGPGTGKTQLLSRKVEYILEHTDTNPENILCLTFTESGASNMRERLKTTIKDAAMKVNIGTYHSFGGEILAQYKNYAPEYDRKLDSVIDEVTKFKIIKALQDELPGTDILRSDNVKDILSVIDEAKSANLSAEDLALIAKCNIEDSEVVSREISPLLQNVVPRAFKASLDNAYRPIFEVLEQYAEATPFISLRDRKLGRTALSVSRSETTEPLSDIERNFAIVYRKLKDALIEAESTQKIKPLTSWKDEFFEKDEKGNYRLRDRVANLKLKSVAEIMKKYQKYLLDNGLYDFNDMIQEAVKALKTDDGFRMTMQEKYQYIMLDEFQDTNPAQLSIVQALTDYEKPMVMAVGDDDQAIYEFQGALSSNMLDFQKHYSANVVPLVENYRSTQEILDFSRRIIEQAPDRFADKELIAHKPDPMTSQIHRHEFLGSDSEFGFVTAKIADLVKSGVNQSEIAVISYKTKYFEPLLSYFKNYPELKIAYEKRDNLFDDEKCHELLTILRFVYETTNEKRVDTSAMEVLSYPCFKLPVLEVLKTVDKARENKRSVIEVAGASEITDIKSAAEFLLDLVAKSFAEPLVNLVLPVAEKIDRSIHDEYERFRFYENIAALMEGVRKHFGETRPLKLKELIEFVDDYSAAEMPFAVRSPYREADDAIQIMTAHKAKGLEFEYVFVISADDTAWGKGGGNNNLLSLPKNLMQIRHTGLSDSERLRILYVTLTRAKKALYITNSLRDFSGKTPKRLEYFKEYAEKDNGGTEIVRSPLIPSGRVNLEYELAPVNVQEENLRNWIRPFVAASPDMRRIYLERMNGWRMSASALTSFIDIVYAGPQEFFKSYVLRVPREAETEALVFGNLIHAVFEAVTNKGISDEEAAEMLVRKVETCDLSEAEAKKLREKGVRDLTISLEQFRDILRQGQAEVDFAPERLVISGVPVTGKIDHMIVDDTARTIEIYDFKTGGYHKEKWSSHATLFKYMLQLGFYKLLLNASPKYRKYRVERAHILFVTPDKDGEVHDKVYEFNDEDEKSLMQLMVAVYGSVKNLDFMDDPEIFVEANNGRGLKDIKEFIKLLLAKTSER